MRRKLVVNILSSGIEKFFILGIQFISSIIIIRVLPRDDYGIIGIVVGYFAFVNIINISLESIILRDHKKFDENLNEVMQNFFVFNVYKSIILALISFILSYTLSLLYNNNNFIYAIWSTASIIIADTITAPFIIYFASKFNQFLVTKISILRYSLGFIFLLGLPLYPHLWYIAVRDLIINLLYTIIWIYISTKKIGFAPQIRIINLSFIKKCFFDFSLWTHLNGIITNFIYRSDPFFLSFFVSLNTVGDYNVALNSANVANILPMIISYQNSIALSHAKSTKHAFQITNTFVKLSFFIGVLTWLGFYFWGKYYLYIITGEKNNEEIFFYMMCIVTGVVIVKSLASPLNAYINIFGNVKQLFIGGMVPLFLFTVLVYFSSSYLYGAKGIAIANIIVSVFWLAIIILMANKDGYKLFFGLLWRNQCHF